MPQLIVTTRAGETRSIEGAAGASMMEAIRDSGIDELLALCGGLCSCATCHVHVDPEFSGLLPAMSDDEDALLDGSRYRDRRSRLACQIRLNDRVPLLRVTIAEED
jgi:2Fe-2S ferredoxin